MRVLWLRPSKGDNISVRRQRIASHLAAHGVEADIVDVTGLDAVDGIRTALLGDYDVILGNVRMGLYLGYPLARLLGLPFVGDVSDPITDIDDLPGPIFKLLEWYEWQVLSRADYCVFTYQSTFEEAEEREIAGSNLPNAVDYETFSDPDPAAVEEAVDILDDSGVDWTRPIAIYIGGFSPEYHIEDILDAARQTPQWNFVFVGMGEQRELVEDAAASVENVFYPGAFEYSLMPGFLAHAEVGFCFKDAEQPLKISEYGAAGLVAIAQPGELSKRFADDEVYFVDPSGDAIRDALTAIADDTATAERFCENLQSRAREVSWQEVADQYYRILCTLTSTVGDRETIVRGGESR
jgi:glycosyltransferase involved in cell wall biosynthesis